MMLKSIVMRRLSKAILCTLASLSCLGLAAQTKDFGVMAGVNIPMYQGVESDAMIGITYGQFSSLGWGYRVGAQWSPSVADVDNLFGFPIAFGYRTRSRDMQERVHFGAAGAADYTLTNGTNGSNFTGGLISSFLMNLFSNMEFLVGLTPTYYAGASGSPSRSWSNGVATQWNETWTEKKQSFGLTADAGLCLNYAIWRFDLKVMPMFHYNVMNSLVQQKTTGTVQGAEEIVKVQDPTPLRWFFTIGAGLSFRF